MRALAAKAFNRMEGLSPTERRLGIAEAQRMAREWTAKHQR